MSELDGYAFLIFNFVCSTKIYEKDAFFYGKGVVSMDFNYSSSGFRHLFKAATHSTTYTKENIIFQVSCLIEYAKSAKHQYYSKYKSFPLYSLNLP